MRTVKYNNHVCILHGFDNVAVTRISSVKENEKSITPEVLPTDAGSGGTPGWQYYCKTGGK